MGARGQLGDVGGDRLGLNPGSVLTGVRLHEAQKRGKGDFTEIKRTTPPAPSSVTSEGASSVQPIGPIGLINPIRNRGTPGAPQVSHTKQRGESY